VDTSKTLLELTKTLAEVRTDQKHHGVTLEELRAALPALTKRVDRLELRAAVVSGVAVACFWVADKAWPYVRLFF
jgi:hypothetical protein